MLKPKVSKSKQVAWLFRLQDSYGVPYEFGNRKERRKWIHKSTRKIGGKKNKGE